MTESSGPPRLRVFLVDDHAMFRAGVRAELAAQLTGGSEGSSGPDEVAGIDVVGEAATVPEAVQKIVATRPDVVLLDVHMPDGGGRAVLATASQLLVAGPPVRCHATSRPASDVVLNGRPHHWAR